MFKFCEKNMIFIMFISLFFVNFCGLGQSCPFEEDQETESIDDIGGEDLNYSFELGETSGDSTLDESDILGSTEEIGEEVGEEIGEEVGEEVITEVVAETAALSVAEAIPGVGVAVAAAMFIYEIFDYVAEVQKQHDERREESKKLFRTAGSYVMPMVPSFPIHGYDLNGAKDSLSYIITLHKQIDSSLVRNYIESIGQTQHIGVEYPIASMQENIAYAFSTFKKDLTKYNDPRYTGGLRMPISASTPDESDSDIPIQLKAAHYHSRYAKQTYKRKVANINLRKVNQGTVYADTKMFWRHDHDPDTEFNAYYWPEGYEHAYSLSKERVLDWTSELVLELVRERAPGKNIIDQSGNISSKDPYDQNVFIPVITDIPYTVEDVGEKLVFKVLNLNIAGLSQEEGDLIFRFKIRAYAHYSTQERYSYEYFGVGPDNFNISDQQFPTTPCVIGPYAYDSELATSVLLNVDDAAKANFNMLLPPPKIEDKILAFFKVHDYQPRSSEKPSIINTDFLGVNLFPTISTAGRTQYNNTNIGRPNVQSSHIKIDIPFNAQAKKIEYVELQNVRLGSTAILKMNISKNTQNTVTKYGVEEAYYHKSSQINKQKLDVYQIVQNANDEKLLDLSLQYPGAYVNKIDTPVSKSYLLLNVPARPNDILDAKVYYTDASFTKKTVKVAFTNNFISRAYYKFDNRRRNLTITHGTRNDGQERREWLVELQPNGFYAIANRETGKVLGFNEGEYGIYDWDIEDLGLYWDLRTSSNDQIKLFNIGQQAYLNLTKDGQLVFDFSDGLEFAFKKVKDATPIIDYDTSSYISNRLNKTILQTSKLGYPELGKSQTLTLENRHSRLHYTGCFTYAIYNEKTQSYLNIKNNQLKWDKDNFVSWLYRLKGDEYFTLSYQEKALGTDDTSETNLKVYDTPNIDMDHPALLSEHKYHFKIKDKINYPDLIAHYTFDYNLNDNSSYQHHGKSHGSVLYVNDPERGKVAQFEGENSYVNTNVDFNPNDFGGDFSISLWMKTDVQSYMNIISGGKTSMSKTTNAISTNLIDDDLTNNNDSVTGGGVTSDQWHYIVSVYDTQESGRKKIKLYVDDVLVSEKESNNDFSVNPLNLMIGSLKGSSYSGYMDDVKIWKKALKSDEISQAYHTNKRTENLIAYYAFENNVKDSSLYERDGTSYGNLAYVTDAERGNVAQFDGVDDYVNTNTSFNANNYGGSITLSYWAKINEQEKNDKLCIWSSPQFTQNFRTGTIEAFLDQFQLISNITQTGDNQWHHITTVYTTDPMRTNRSVVYQYIDGEFSIANYDLPQFKQIASDLFVGKSKINHHLTHNNYANYKGLLDDFKIWKTALSADEIKKEYETSKVDASTLPLALYKFENNTKDSSGNNHHGTSYGGLTYVNDAERGNVAKFNGRDSYVNTNTIFDPKNYNGNLSIGFWMKDNLDASDNPYLIEGGNYEISKYGAIWPQETGPLFASVNYESPSLYGSSVTVLSENNIPENEWTHVLFVIKSLDDGKIKTTLYLNGIDKRTTTSNQPQEFKANTSNTVIGTDLAKHHFETYDGYLDDVTVWGKAISAKEALQNYEKSKVTNQIGDTNIENENNQNQDTDESGTEILVSPNPANTILNINTDKSINNSKVYSLSSPNAIKEFGSEKTLDVTSIAEGHYILTISFSDESTESLRFVIQRD